MPDSLKILIVEDDTITAMDLRETLEDAGYTVTSIARNFEQALKAVKKHPPDLALIDIHLEGSSADGIATTQALLALHSMPIIYLTANSEPQTFRAAKETLPAAYLLKPFRHDELTLQVELAYHYFQSKLTSDADPEQLFLPIDKGHKKINLKDVLYIQADGSYVKIFIVRKEIPYHVSTNLSHLAQYFRSPNFHRLSRSMLINLDYLERLERNHLFMVDHKIAIQIPTTGRKELMKKITIVRTK